jgi:hypothetical protein
MSDKPAPETAASRSIPPAVLATIIVAIIGLLGTVTVGVLEFIIQPSISLHATQTAEAKPSPTRIATTAAPTEKPTEQATTPSPQGKGSVEGLITIYGLRTGIPNVTVTLNGGYSTLTDGSGRFSIPNVPVGKYSLGLRAVGYEYADAPLIDITAGQMTSMAEIKLIPLPSKSGRNATLGSGQCFDFELASKKNCTEGFSDSKSDFRYLMNEAGVASITIGSNPLLELRNPDQDQITYPGCYDAPPGARGWPALVSVGEVLCFKTSNGNLAAILVTAFGDTLNFDWELWTIK